jgi:phage repressor protein C with HTH and peptisase S24 domain
MTSSTRMLEFIEFKGIKKSNFYKQIGLSNGYLDKIKELGSEKIESILKFYPDLNTYWLITGKGSMLLENTKNKSSISEIIKIDPNRIPIYEIEASAGEVVLLKDFNSNESTGYISVPGLPKCDGAIRVVGDSMYPLLKSGDLVAYKIADIQSIIYGEMYIIDWFSSHDDFLMVKYLKSSKDKSKVLLVSANKHHDDLEIGIDSIRQLALVKASIRINTSK